MFEVRLEINLADGWGLGANSAELTTAELVAGGVVHRPISAGGVFLGALEMQAKIVHPFVELVWGTEGEARDKAMFLVEEDLGGTDDDTFDRGVEDNLPGDGIEGHLVVGFVLVEVVLGWGGDGGFVVHHEEKEELMKVPIGERLYNNYIKKSKKKQDHINKLQNIKRDNEMKGVTFTPELNPKSRDLSNYSHNNDESIEDRLLKLGSERQSRLQEQQMIKKLKDYEYSYSPNIDSKSNSIAQKVRNKRKEALS